MTVTLDRSFFSKLSGGSKILGLSLVVGYIVVALSRNGEKSLVLNNLALVAGKTFPFGCWNVFTSAFVEDSLPSLICMTLPLSIYLAHVLEPIQGQKALAKIVLVTVCSSGILTFLAIWLCYVVGSIASRESADVMASTVLYAPVCGFQGAIAGLLVALKQAVPESEVRITHAIKLKTTFVPVIYVVCVCALGLLGGQGLKYVPLTVFGWYASWIYLRYFHPMPDSGLRGDPSDQFSVLSFFPEVIQKNPTLNAICSKLHTSLGPLQGYGQRQQDQSTVDLDLEINRDGNATRRRERGMKALEERIASSTDV